MKLIQNTSTYKSLEFNQLKWTEVIKEHVNFLGIGFGQIIGSFIKGNPSKSIFMDK